MPDLPRAALLWEQLPAESRTARALSPELTWGTAEYLLWQIEYGLRCLTWSLSGDKGTPRPQPIQTPGQLADAHRRRDEALANRGEIDKILGMEGTDG